SSKLNELIKINIVIARSIISIDIIIRIIFFLFIIKPNRPIKKRNKERFIFICASHFLRFLIYISLHIKKKKNSKLLLYLQACYKEKSRGPKFAQQQTLPGRLKKPLKRLRPFTAV